MMMIIILLLLILMKVSTFHYHHQKYQHIQQYSQSQKTSTIITNSITINTTSHLNYYNDPEVEILRQRLYSNLKAKLFSGVRRAGCDSRRGWLKAFEKWQFIAKLTEHHNTITVPIKNKDNNNTSPNINAIALFDPLIPCMLPNSNNMGYQKMKEYLANLENMPKNDADIVALELTIESYNQVIHISEFSKLKQLNNNTNGNDTDINISYDIETALFYLSLVKNSQKLNEFLDYKNNLESVGIVSIKTDNVKSLYRRWLNNNKESYDNPPPAFYRDLYILLLRYKSLEGFGWQAAIPDTVFAFLYKHFGVNTECFASPLNAYLPNYCSVFNDSDKPFGSLGSFFDQEFNEGCYEANPPFTPELFEVMINHMNKMMDVATGPLMFIIFAPAWTEDPHWLNLINAKYYKYSFIVQSADHTYCDGAYHKQPKLLLDDQSKYRPAPFDTGIVFFANDKGIEKWRLENSTFEENIRSAFSVAKPSLASIERFKKIPKYIPKSLRPKK